MKRLIFALVIIFLSVLLAGCGSSGGGPAAGGGAGTGKAVFTVTWPSRARLIPEASNSIQITINQGAKQVGQQLLARPISGSNTTTATFPLLPVGTLSVTATAFPNADGSGTAQSTATVPVTIQANQITPLDLTMNSTIDHLEMTTPSATLASGSSEQLSMVAKDATGAVVLTSPDKIQWTSSDATLAAVDNTGKVTGALMGAPTIVVTDTESGKSANTTITVYVVVTVTPTTQTLTLGNMFTFTAAVAGSANQAVNWSVQEGTNGGSITTGGVYAAPQQPGTYHVIAASQADTSRTNTATVTVQAGNANGTIQ